METIVGIVIFMAVIIPVTTYLARIATSSKAADLQVAEALLKGESDMVYRAACLPDSLRAVQAGTKAYAVVCRHDADTGLVSWHLGVAREGREIAAVDGLVYVPAPGLGCDQKE